jgi:hypothetical protein
MRERQIPGAGTLRGRRSTEPYIVPAPAAEGGPGVKRLLLVVVVVALALTVIAPLAAAKPGGDNKHGHYRFNVVGKLAADPTAASLLITVKGGSHIRGLKKTDATFYVAADARIVQLTDDGQAVKMLTDIVKGDWVKARGTLTVTTDDAGNVVRTYTIKSLKYKDLTPDEVTPPAQP